MSIQEDQKTGRRLISHAEVRQRVQLSTTHIFRLLHDPHYAHLNFPKPAFRGLGKSGRLFWTEDSIDRWIDEQEAAANEEVA